MSHDEIVDSPPPPELSLLLAAELQDHLMTATNDLERLQRLLDDAREPAYIKTVRSEGYVFSLPVEVLGELS